MDLVGIVTPLSLTMIVTARKTFYKDSALYQDGEKLEIRPDEYVELNLRGLVHVPPAPAKAKEEKAVYHTKEEKKK